MPDTTPKGYHKEIHFGLYKNINYFKALYLNKRDICYQTISM